ncbi:TPA: hypothetical protein N0F65_005901, partial [Lagenidium giganteum]
ILRPVNHSPNQAIDYQYIIAYNNSSDFPSSSIMLETLQAQLDDVRKQRALLQTSLVDLQHTEDVEEKQQLKKAIRDLLVFTPEVTVLGAQTGAVVERIANANEVAERMTREVRCIDIVQSRLSKALGQSGQLVNLKNAMAGIRRAMNNRQYAQAAGFLKELKDIEEIMPLDVADKLRVENIENDLKGIIESHFETGLRERIKPQINEYAPLFRHIGVDYEERGLQLFLSFVRANLEESLSSMTKGSFSIKELLAQETAVFNQVAACVQEHDQMVTQCFARVAGNRRLVAQVYAVCEKISVPILRAYMQQRNLHERMSVTNEQSNAGAGAKGPQLSPTARPSSPPESENEIATLNDQLHEIALVIQHTQTFERFMRSRVEQVNSEADTEADTVANNQHDLPASHESELGKTVQELAGFYCFFENDLLTKAARRAFQWEELRYSSAKGAQDVVCFPISSAVDEIFYVARNSGLRSLATGHPDCVAGVLNMVSTVLRDIFGDNMRSRIRNMAAHVKLDGHDMAHQLRDQMQQQMQQHLAKFSKMGPLQLASAPGQPAEVKKELSPEVVMNSLEASVDYLAQIKDEFERELPQDFPEVPRRLISCLNGLDESASELTQLLSACRKKLGKLLEPKLASFLGNLISSNAKKAVHYELSEQQFTFNEANDPFAHQFVASTRELVQAFQPNLSPGNLGSLMETIAATTVELIERWFYSKPMRFNQLGALQFDKDIRTVSTFFTDTCDSRLVFARLTQIALVLNMDSPADVVDFHGRRYRGVDWQLSSAQVKEVLSRRVEFADAAINRLNEQKGERAIDRSLDNSALAVHHHHQHPPPPPTHMMKAVFLAVAALAGVMHTSAAEANSELLRLVTLSRHGSRAPNGVVARICPNNLKNLDAYNVPLEQLTEYGMHQLLAVGKHIRDVYVKEKGFLSETFNGVNHTHFETYFRSDAATRCSQSATALGYGLYPDGTGPKGFPRQPVPVTMQLLPNEHDFAAPKGPCKPTLKQDLEEYAKTRAVELLGQYQDALDTISKACGVNLADVPTMQGGEDLVLAVKDIADMLIFDRDEKLPRIQGVDEETSAKIEQLAFQNLMERYYSSDREITYWNGGFPNVLLGNLNAAANPAFPTRTAYRYYSYHGHRELLHGLGKMIGFNFNFTGLPSAMGMSALHPGTTMFFELHGRKGADASTQEYFVKTFVWSPKTEREQVKLEKCSSLECPLTEFNAIIRNHIASTGTWEEICGYHPVQTEKLSQLVVDANDAFPTSSNGYLTVMSVALCMCTVFAMYKAAIRIKNFRRRGYIPL